MPENATVLEAERLSETYDDAELREQNGEEEEGISEEQNALDEEYISGTINEYGDSGVQNELRRLETRYTKRDNSGSYEIVLDSARQLIGSLDDYVSRDDFPVKYGALMMKYSRLITACDSYLRSHSGFRFTSVGRGRVRTIRQMILNAQREMEILRSRGGQVAASENSMTWRMVLFGPDRALNNYMAEFREERPGAETYSSDYTSIMSAESFRELLGGRMDTNEQRIYDLLSNIDTARNPNFPALSGYLDQLLEAIGPNPGKSAPQLLKNQVEQRLRETDTTNAATEATERAVTYAREMNERTGMRDMLLDEMREEELPPHFKRSTEYSRVVMRMVPGNAWLSRQRLQNEIAYHVGKKTPGMYETIRSGMADELRRIVSFRLLNLNEGQIMENYEEITRLEMSVMHLTDLGKLRSSRGRFLKSEVWSEMGITEDMASCICQILGCYQNIGRALWSLRALDLGWVPTIDQLATKDRNYAREFMDSNGVIDVEKFRSYLTDRLLPDYRQNLAFLRENYREVIDRLMQMG